MVLHHIAHCRRAQLSCEVLRSLVALCCPSTPCSPAPLFPSAALRCAAVLSPPRTQLWLSISVVRGGLRLKHENEVLFCLARRRRMARLRAGVSDAAGSPAAADPASSSNSVLQRPTVPDIPPPTPSTPCSSVSLGWQTATYFNPAGRDEHFVGHAPRGGFCVKVGDYVTVKPDGSRRDDVHIQEEEWVAQVRALAIADLLGPLVKLRWFIRSRDLWLRQCSDTFTSDYFKLAGENELFPLRHETITSGDAIHEVIAVERFDPASISLRAFNDKTLYYREGYYFERVLIADFYRLPRDTVTLLCTGSECTFHGLYDPDEHKMRYCHDCAMWFHIQCMEESDVESPTLPPYIQPRNPSAALPVCQEAHDHWQNLLRYPIQRGTHQIGWLLSFEMLVSRIRMQESTSGCPPDVNSFLIANMPLAPHLAHYLDTYLRIFLNQPPNPRFYSCPTCDCYI
ncbi:hypothetical protein NUW54_g4418 [Trametes sanguinea]|uniref:Uncharacterized protein n=1 Tax=Trametes sanguinea TaxID=158606 RepID=A0ACC1Q121_9APHY|nr:hypothetical protein NUW54_g4418 [Trametes sanguinea]